ncbi:dynamin family protein [Succinimonas sp.]|uniref:dynamin family protein n=1 Tax=Succinimonas sp. TaxID=1936151 RepID=UPI003863A32B
MENHMTPEKQKYVDKLGRQIASVKKILEIDSGTVLSNEEKDKLRKLKDEAECLKRKLENNEFEIAIVGLEKAGKSTFANALMKKKDMLPTKDGRCTFTSTLIKYAGEDRAEVSFYTQEEFNRDFQDKLHKMEMPDWQRYSFDTLPSGSFKRFCENELDFNARKLHKDMIDDVNYIIEYRDEISRLLDKPVLHLSGSNMTDLKPFITDGSKAYAVKMVRIWSQALQHMPNAVIYDVPGFNSPTELHKKQTRERMKSADAIIVVAGGDAPSITGESLKILQESDDEGNRLSDKLFVFANKIDRATDIANNIDETYSEWIDRWRFLSHEQKKRIVFGSALLYLEQLDSTNPEEPGMATRTLGKRFDDLPDGCGVEAIKDRMKAYNEHERFEVLKRRINRFKAQIEEVFSKMREAYDCTETAGYSEEHLKLLQHLQHRVPKEAVARLNRIKSEMNKRFTEVKPLSETIRSYISDTITADKYQIEDEDIKTVKERGGMTGSSNENLRTIETIIRRTKFDRMYNEDFCRSVISFASGEHQAYTKEILDALMEALEVSAGSPFYQELRNELAQELSPWRGSQSDDSRQEDQRYLTLVEQFSRDLYEVLIYCPYTEERLRKFYDNLNRFFALSVFYRKPDSTEDELAYIRIPPEEQPLCTMLIFHDNGGCAGKWDELLRELSRVTSLESGDIQKAKSDLFRILSACGGKVADVVSRFEKKFVRALNMSGDFKLNLLKATISELCNSVEPVPSIADKDKFTEHYKKFHSSLRPGLVTEDEIKEDFRADVEILRDVLMNAVVSAIDMDNPFLKNEFRSVEDIVKHYVESEDKFIAFIRRNLRKIKDEESSRLDRQERQRRQNQDIAREVNSILQTMADNA